MISFNSRLHGSFFSRSSSPQGATSRFISRHKAYITCSSHHRSPATSTSGVETGDFSTTDFPPPTTSDSQMNNAVTWNILCGSGSLPPNSCPLPLFRVIQSMQTSKSIVKSDNQDRGVISLNDSFSISCIFDGHGGSFSSSYASAHLPQLIMETLQSSLLSITNQNELEEESSRLISEDLVWLDSFRRVDDAILFSSQSSGSLDGSTALVGFHLHDQLLVANAGDSRAVLCRDGLAKRLSQDHTPELAGERARIELEAKGTGCHVAFYKGVWRVILAADPVASLPIGDSSGEERKRRYVKLCSTSRALGDLDFKEAGLIICDPDITRTKLTRQDEFSIFASDGVWHNVRDQQAVRAVKKSLSESSHLSEQERADKAAGDLIELALICGSQDDITVIINLYSW